MLEFVRFVFGGPKMYAGMVKIAPWLIALKAGLYPAHKAKEKLLSVFFKNMSIETFNLHAKNFSETALPALLRPSAMKELAMHKQLGNRVVVVSASAENWVKDSCDKHQLICIATKLQIDDNGKLTGKEAREALGMTRRAFEEMLPRYGFSILVDSEENARIELNA